MPVSIGPGEVRPAGYSRLALPVNWANSLRAITSDLGFPAKSGRSLVRHGPAKSGRTGDLRFSAKSGRAVPSVPKRTSDDACVSAESCYSQDMRELKSDKARREFRDLLDEVERSPAAAIRILRYERPVAVMVSATWYDAVVDHIRRTPGTHRLMYFECPRCGRQGPWTNGRSVEAGDEVDEYWCQVCGAESPLSACEPFDLRAVSPETRNDPKENES
jgi:predicted RNA-binding Zn-ribbon protein involved in translation (DUF1610 family)